MGYSRRKLNCYKEPNFKELLWFAFIHWRGLLLIAIIFGLLGTGVFYLRDYRSAVDKRLSEDIVSEAEAYQEKTDQLAVDSILSREKTLEKTRNYYQESLLMKMDPYNIHVRTYQYQIKLNEDDADADIGIVKDSYYYGLDYSIANGLKDSLEMEADNPYIRELISICDAAEEDPIRDKFTIRVFMTEDMDSAAVDQVVQTAVAERNVYISDTGEQHDVELASIVDAISADQDTIDKQYSTMIMISDLENFIAEKRRTLTETQRELYMRLKKSGEYQDALQTMDVSEPKSEATETGNDLNNIHLSKKGFVYGFVLGIIIYIVIYIIFLMMRKTIESAEKIEETMGYRLLGELREVPAHSGLQKAFLSKKLYKLHYREKTDAEKQINKAVDTILSLSDHYHMEHISLVPLGMPSASSERHLGELEAALATKLSVNMLPLYADGKMHYSEKDFSVAENVILIVFANRTTDRMMEVVDELCRVYDKKVPGFLFMEG